VKLVQTLVVRDEADIVDAQIAYHLHAGVDFVIATDHESQDGTTDILEGYARDGYLLRIAEHGENREHAWRTRMARLAASRYGADWVINTDADEFWITGSGTLKDALAPVPPRYGIVWALSRHFPPRPDDGEAFFERMTARVSFPVAINDPTSAYRPHVKVAHRADPDIIVGHGAHGAHSRRFLPFPNWYAAEVFHFPFRTLEQWERKGVRRALADKPLGQYVRALRARDEGRTRTTYDALLVDEATLRRGVVEGCLVVDTRLRDALRALSGDRPHEDHVGRPGIEHSLEVAAYRLDRSLIAEGAGVLDADIVRLSRRIDALGLRTRMVEDQDLGARARSSNL
jgi:hypothetical protein